MHKGMQGTQKRKNNLEKEPNVDYSQFPSQNLLKAE